MYFIHIYNLPRKGQPRALHVCCYIILSFSWCSRSAVPPEAFRCPSEVNTHHSAACVYTLTTQKMALPVTHYFFYSNVTSLHLSMMPELDVIHKLSSMAWIKLRTSQWGLWPFHKSKEFGNQSCSLAYISVTNVFEEIISIKLNRNTTWHWCILINITICHLAQNRTNTELLL